MNKEKLINIYESRGLSKEKIDVAIADVLALEIFLDEKSTDLESCTEADIKEYIASLLKKGEINPETLLAMARYFYAIDKNSIYIFFTKLFGGMGVLDSIKSRMIKYAGETAASKVFDGFKYPPLGTPIEEMPKYTEDLMKRIQNSIDSKLYQKVLAGNNHGIPAESMQSEKKYYESSQSMEQYLEERHERKVRELQEYCDANQVWFEQDITQPVVDYVASNQEILSAVKKGNKLYVTKIPYDTVSYLNAETDAQRNYYACHCTFAREAILSGNTEIPSDWCYCSAGFAKFPFEQILGRELNVKVINSALDGDGLCRFEIDLGES